MDPVERIDEERPGCRVILCCKNDIYSAGIASILGAATGIDLVGQFDSETFSVHAITQLSPGVLIIDADVFPVSYAEAIIAEARRAGAGAVVLVSSIDVSMVTQVLKAGARGVLTRNASGNQLITAIRNVCGGEAALDPFIARCFLDWLRRGPQALSEHHHAPAKIFSLTDRQREILILLGQGLANDEIAKRLFLGTPTIKSHVSALLRVLGLRDRTQLAIFACKYRVMIEAVGLC